MHFTEQVIRIAWNRSGGRCECRRGSHLHTGRCTAMLDQNARGKAGAAGWEACGASPRGPNTPENCQILCRRCYEVTLRRRER